MKLSHKQFAEHVAKEGGGSVGFFSREPVTGKGFMTAISGSEHVAASVTPGSIAKFARKNAAKARTVENPVHGVWGTTQDISVQAATPNKAKAIGVPTGEKAAYGLSGTRVSQRGHHMGAGGDVLFHTASLGKHDVDPRYRPGALDTEGQGSFTRNQYTNKDFRKTAGTSRDPSTGKMRNVSYGEVLTKINENRAERVRQGKGYK